MSNNQATAPAPETWNDAELWGVDSPEWLALLQRKMTFTVGAKRDQYRWPKKDRQTLPWAAWIEGGVTEGKPWGLSRHPVSPRKDGTCLVLGGLAGDERKARAVVTVDAVGLDIDSGEAVTPICEHLESLGVAALIYTTHSDGARQSDVSRDVVLRALGIARDPTNGELRQYLAMYDKHFWTHEHIASVRIVNAKEHTDRGLRIVYSHAELEKFRIIFPLAEAVLLADLAETQKESLSQFADTVRGLEKLAGVHADPACSDPSRLFYTPRHKEGADYYCAVIRGRPIRWEEIERVPPPSRRSGGKDSEAVTPSGESLKRWAAQGYAQRLQLAELLATECPERIRGSSVSDKVEVECPFEAEHSTEGGTGCWAEDAIARDNGYAWGCHHTACSGRDRLDFIAGALAADWFPEELLTDEDRGYLLPADDDDEAPSGPVPASAGDGDTADAGAEPAPALLVNEEDHADLVDHARTELAKVKGADAVYHFVDTPACIRADAKGVARIAPITSTEKMRARINDHVRYKKQTSDKSTRQVAVPYDVASDVLHGDLRFLPPLTGVVRAPFFAPDGDLIASDGYHAGTGKYLALPAGFELPPVPKVPNGDDVAEARRILIEEALGDFPIGGADRSRLVAGDLSTEESASLAHAVAMICLPFCRELIDGPTPGHLLNKPAPGTGASLLTDVVSLIATGETASAMTLPENREEVGKTLTACLREGRALVYFDNINHAVDTGELASAMTAPTYSARILGQSETVEVDVRCMWTLTGNGVLLSRELARRCILIHLDARTDRPEDREGFRHGDIRAWVRAHRGELVWACLTLIQNWIAKGRAPGTERMGSYESWASVMGGILRDAEIPGFLANRNTLYSSTEEAPQQGILDLLDELAKLPDGAFIRAGGDAPVRGQEGVKVYSLIDILNRAGSREGPIIIEGWGFNIREDRYVTPNRMTRAWRELAKRSREGVGPDGAPVRLSFEWVEERAGRGYHVVRRACAHDP